jgi:hypothetical protein
VAGLVRARGGRAARERRYSQPARPGTTLPFPAALAARTLRLMDDRNPADDLPELYRAVLDALARLESAGDRNAAFDLRTRAHRTYATRWDEGGRRALQKIAREADARLAPGRRNAARKLAPGVPS